MYKAVHGIGPVRSIIIGRVVGGVWPVGLGRGRSVEGGARGRGQGEKSRGWGPMRTKVMGWQRSPPVREAGQPAYSQVVPKAGWWGGCALGGNWQFEKQVGRRA